MTAIAEQYGLFVSRMTTCAMDFSLMTIVRIDIKLFGFFSNFLITAVTRNAGSFSNVFLGRH